MMYECMMYECMMYDIVGFMLEKLHIPAVYLVHRPVLECFAKGLTSATVLHCDEDMSYATSVYQVYIYVCMCIYVCICVYICVYVCDMYVCVYILCVWFLCVCISGLIPQTHRNEILCRRQTCAFVLEDIVAGNIYINHFAYNMIFRHTFIIIWEYGNNICAGKKTQSRYECS